MDNKLTSQNRGHQSPRQISGAGETKSSSAEPLATNRNRDYRAPTRKVQLANKKLNKNRKPTYGGPRDVPHKGYFAPTSSCPFEGLPSPTSSLGLQNAEEHKVPLQEAENVAETELPPQNCPTPRQNSIYSETLRTPLLIQEKENKASPPKEAKPTLQLHNVRPVALERVYQQQPSGLHSIRLIDPLVRDIASVAIAGVPDDNSSRKLALAKIKGVLNNLTHVPLGVARRVVEDTHSSLVPSGDTPPESVRQAAFIPAPRQTRSLWQWLTGAPATVIRGNVLLRTINHQHTTSLWSPAFLAVGVVGIAAAILHVKNRVQAPSIHDRTYSLTKSTIARGTSLHFSRSRVVLPNPRPPISWRHFFLPVLALANGVRLAYRAYQRSCDHEAIVLAAQKTAIYSDMYNLDNTCSLDPTPWVHAPLLIAKKEIERQKEPTFQADETLSIGKLERGRGPAFVETLKAPAVRCAIPCWPKADGFADLVAIEQRVFGATEPQPAALALFNQWLIPFFKENVADAFPACMICYSGLTHEENYDAWNCSEGKEARIKPLMAKAHDEAVIDNYSSSGPTTVKTFTKDEPSMNTSNGFTAYESITPRVIMNASNQFHTRLGPVTFARSKALKKRWNHENWCFYATAAEPLDLGGYLPVDCDTYYVGDVSRFDRGLAEPTLKTLDEAWAQHEPDELVRAVTRSQLKTTALSAQGRHRYTFIGKRRSGDDNTSVDNTLLNISAHVYAVCVELNLSVKAVSEEFKFMALGDDIVVSGGPSLRKVDFKKTLAGIGWAVKPKFVHDIRDVEFCSKQLWPTNDGLVFANKIGRTLMRFPYNSSPSSKVEAGSKAQGILVENGHVPILSDYLKLVALKNGVKLHYYGDNFASFYAICPDTADWLAHRYDLSQRDIDSWVQHLSEWKGGPATYSHYVSDVILEKEGLTVTS